MTTSRLKPQVILLGVAALLNDSASELIYPLLPVFLSATLGASPAIIGIIEGAADGLASILKYFAGAWSDRAGRRKPLIVAGYGLAAASRALIAVATAWPFVLLARLLDRTGKGARSAPRDALISDVTPPEQRGRAFGFHRALDHTGAIVGPLLAMLLLQGLGFSLRQAIMFAVIPGAIGTVMLAVL
ncbi:MAG TPA: MFS transporter, partial [Thermoanaerobaculia bacterium]|nr:MFS transporter [Thermoanaerobaculia bacterium]